MGVCVVAGWGIVCFQKAPRWLFRSLVRTTPLWGKNPKLGELRLWFRVRYCTGLGTMAENGAFMLGVADFRNFRGIFIGIMANKIRFVSQCSA